MAGFLTRLFGRTDDVQTFDAPVAPQEPFSVIGDLHGCAEAFDRVLARLDLSEKLVLVGDYIDRGPDSAAVLDRIAALQTRHDVVCIRGNHEQMCLDFLDTPTRAGGRRWLQHGGVQTLVSFGIRPQGDTLEDSDLTALSDALRTAMGSARIDWMRSLPTMWQSGNVAVVHAAADPDLPLSGQSDDCLMWGHPKFRTVPRKDARWVVHGHTIVPEAFADQGRIAVDTGAYRSGRLSAVTIHDGRLFFTQS